LTAALLFDDFGCIVDPLIFGEDFQEINTGWKLI